jgi:predicted MPP superfamily phosphohydrolase
VDRVTVPIKNLKSGLEGFTIAQMSDIHLRPFTQPALVKKAVEMTNRLHPDLVALTGDFVWKNKEAAFELAPILAGLNARHGVYSIWGNHDLWLDIDVIKTAFSESRLPVLVNQVTTELRPFIHDVKRGTYEFFMWVKKHFGSWVHDLRCFLTFIL